MWTPGSGDAGASALSGVLSSTPISTTVILPASRRRAARSERSGLDESTRARLTVLAGGADAGFAASLNKAAQVSARADLVIVADACTLPPGWLDRMHDAAYADAILAGATALAVGAGEDLFSGFDGDPVFRGRFAPLGVRLAANVPGSPPEHQGKSQTAPLHPRIWTLWPHCAYVRRDAIELLDGFDVSLEHPAAVLSDFAARALGAGLSCALADDVCVERLAGGLAPCPEAEVKALARLHPWLEAARRDESALGLGPLRRSLLRARVARTRPSITIDARSLGLATGGTQTYAAALPLALARSERLAIRVVVSRNDAPSAVVDEFERAGVEVVSYEQAAAGLARTDVVHRPQQVFTASDLRLLRMLGERIVVTQPDLISYRNPTYHHSAEDWEEHRRRTRLALAAVDRVIFFSEHARTDAVAEDLIEPGRTAVAGIGVQRPDEGAERRQPAAVPLGRSLLVMIGADYMHKNRLFALKLVDELRRNHGWDGLLVLAGAHVDHGSSAEAEAELLGARPELNAHVLDLGPVPEPEKRWLLEHAQALLCPSTYEGFGLTPLEAAAAGLPCIYAACTSLSEVVGPEAATIVPWDAAASADGAVGLLRPGEQRDEHLAALAAALRRADWEPIVERLHQVYADAIAAPYRSAYQSAFPRSWDGLEREQLIADLDAAHGRIAIAHRDLQQRVGHGLPLIDRGGMLTIAQQKGLVRVASRPWLKGVLLAPFAFIGGLTRPRSGGADADEGPG